MYHEERSLTMTSTRKIKKGEEILNDYGPLPRSDLLRRYGYITVNNKQWDVVEISITLLSEAARAIQGLSSESIDERVSDHNNLTNKLMLNVEIGSIRTRYGSMGRDL